MRAKACDIAGLSGLLSIASGLVGASLTVLLGRSGVFVEAGEIFGRLLALLTLIALVAFFVSGVVFVVVRGLTGGGASGSGWGGADGGRFDNAGDGGGDGGGGDGGGG